jgi:hypothetical protein
VHPPELDASADHKVLSGDDAGDVGVSSVEPNAPGPIRSGVLEKSKPSAANQVLVVPPSSRRRQKCPPPTTKQSNTVPPADQVMTQVELPPYHRPCSPLDLVAIEFIFGRIFEAFQQISQAVVAGATSADDNKQLKRFCRPPLKKALVLRYLCILFSLPFDLL